MIWVLHQNNFQRCPVSRRHLHHLHRGICHSGIGQVACNRASTPFLGITPICRCTTIRFRLIAVHFFCGYYFLFLFTAFSGIMRRESTGDDIRRHFLFVWNRNDVFAIKCPLLPSHTCSFIRRDSVNVPESSADGDLRNEPSCIEPTHRP